MSDKMNKPLKALKTRRRHKSTWATKHNWREKFLKSLTDTPNISLACDEASVSLACVYAARKRSKVFDNQWQQALKLSVGKLAKSAMKRARDGVERRVWMKDESGKPVCVDKVVEYSDSLAVFLLKTHAPEIYQVQPKEATATVTLPDGEQVAFSVGVPEENLPE